MNYRYCPIPWNSLGEIGTSCSIKPFVWDENSVTTGALPWKGLPALLFFTDIPQINSNRNNSYPIIILKVCDDLVLDACDISDGLRLPQKTILAQFHTISLIPGKFWILIEDSDHILREAVFQLSGSGLQAKFSDSTAQQIILPMHGGSVKYPTWDNQIESVEMGYERLRQRIVAFHLSLILAKAKLVPSPSWVDMLVILFRLRKVIAAQRTDKAFERVSKEKDELNQILREMLSLLIRLTGQESVNLVRDWVTKEVQQRHRNFCNDAVISTIDFILKEGGTVVHDILLESVFNSQDSKTGQALEFRSSLWSMYAQYRKAPYKIEELNKFGQVIQEKVYQQDMEMINKLIISRKSDEITLVSGFVELPEEDQLLFEKIRNTILLFELDIPTANWKIKGFDEINRKKLLDKIMQEVHSESIAIKKEWEIIQRYLNNNIQVLLFEAPKLRPVLLNLLIFLMNPLDDRRLREQQKAWRCPQPEIGIAIQSGFLGFGSVPGYDYYPFFEVIQNDTELQNAVGQWFNQCEKTAIKLWDKHLIGRIDQVELFSNINKHEVEQTETKDMITILDNPVSSNQFNDLDSKIVILLQQNLNGLTKNTIAKELNIESKCLEKVFSYLKKEKKITCYKQGGSYLWKLI